MKWSHILPFIFFIIAIVGFFNSNLLGVSLFATPDFGRSDILHLEYPSLQYFARSLKSGIIPFWNPYVGSGETLLPSLNPINLLLLYLLPTSVAYSWIYAITFLLHAVFTYAFSRLLKLSRVSSTMVGFIVAFSGVVTAQLPHQSLVQTLSFLPVQLFLLEYYLQKRDIRVLFAAPFAIAMQITSGFYQVFLYTTCFSFLYLLLRLLFEKKSTSQKLLTVSALTLSFIAGLLLSFPQLLPTLDLVQTSIRQGGVSDVELARFPYPIKHIFALFNPYLFGDPRIGTYPPFSKNWGIFWENTTYIGVFSLILVGVSIATRLKKSKRVLIFSLLSLVTFLLMLGNRSPLFFVQSLPVFSFFRVPSRWIGAFTFSLAMLAGFGMEKLLKDFDRIFSKNRTRILAHLLVLGIVCADVYLFAYTYNARIPTASITTAPETAQFILKKNKDAKIASFGSDIVWNSYFLTKGWKQDPMVYTRMLGALNANSNMLFSLHQIDAYSPLSSQRAAVLSELIRSDMIQETANDDATSITIGPAANRVLNSKGAQFVITPFDLQSENSELKFSSTSHPTYHVYERTGTQPRAFISTSPRHATSLQNAAEIMLSSTFDPSQEVIVEQKNFTLKKPASLSNIKVIEDAPQKVVLRVNTDGDGILVLADSYYAKWRATIDGKATEILPANINQRAIYVDTGSHTVEFTLDTSSFTRGLLVMVATTLVLISCSAYLKATSYAPNASP